MIEVKIDNDYEDGHHSDRVVLLPSPFTPPPGHDLGDWWWDDVVWPQTGDGHGSDGLEAHYTATILTGPLAGTKHEWRLNAL